MSYFLLNVEEINSLHPENLKIADSEIRHDIREGDIAMLMFELAQNFNPEIFDTEQMCVLATGIENGNYTGLLANSPTTDSTLKPGDRIEFKAENVIMVIRKDRVQEALEPIRRLLGLKTNFSLN